MRLSAGWALSTVLFCALAGPAFAGGSAAGTPFYLLEAQNFTLVTGNTFAPAETTVVGGLPIAFWSDMATGLGGDELYAVDVDALAIARVRASDASIAGRINLDRNLRNVATDTDAGLIYALPADGPLELFTVNPLTGVTLTIGLTGIAETAGEVTSLGYDPVRQRLLSSTTTGRLYAIDPVTAETQLLTTQFSTRVFDIAFNYGNGQMYATDADADSLFVLDRASNELLLVGGPYATSPRATGLAFLVPEPGAALSLLGLAVLVCRRGAR